MCLKMSVPDLGSGTVRYRGSSPLSRTTQKSSNKNEGANRKVSPFVRSWSVMKYFFACVFITRSYASRLSQDVMETFLSKSNTQPMF